MTPIALAIAVIAAGGALAAVATTAARGAPLPRNPMVRAPGVAGAGGGVPISGGLALTGYNEIFSAQYQLYKAEEAANEAEVKAKYVEYGEKLGYGTTAKWIVDNIIPGAKWFTEHILGENWAAGGEFIDEQYGDKAQLYASQVIERFAKKGWIPVHPDAFGLGPKSGAHAYAVAMDALYQGILDPSHSTMFDFYGADVEHIKRTWKRLGTMTIRGVTAGAASYPTFIKTLGGISGPSDCSEVDHVLPADDVHDAITVHRCYGGGGTFYGSYPGYNAFNIAGSGEHDPTLAFLIALAFVDLNRSEGELAHKWAPLISFAQDRAKLYRGGHDPVAIAILYNEIRAFAQTI